MTEVTFVKSKSADENMYSFDGEWFCIYNVFEKHTYKFDKRAKILFDLLDKQMNLTDIVNYFKSISLIEDGDSSFTENDLFDMLQIFLENALLISENIEV